MGFKRIGKRAAAGLTVIAVVLCAAGILPTVSAEPVPVFVENWGVYDADTNPDGTLIRLDGYGYDDLEDDDVDGRVMYGEPDFAVRRDGGIWTGHDTDTTNDWYIKPVSDGIAARATVDKLPISISLDTAFTSIKKLTFTLDMTNSNWPPLGAIRIYTNEDKTSYLEFGMKGWRPAAFVWASDNISSAYVKVVKDGVAVMQAHNANVGEHTSNYSFGGHVVNHFMPNQKVVEWTIITDGERIGWEAFATGKGSSNNGETVAWRVTNYLDGFADRGDTPTTSQSNIPQTYDAANNRFNFDDSAKFNQDFVYNDADYGNLFSNAENYTIEFLAAGYDDVTFKDLRIWDEGIEQRNVNLCINGVQHKTAVEGRIDLGQKNGAAISGIVSPTLAGKTLTLTTADGEIISAVLNADGEWMPAIDDVEIKYSALTLPDGTDEIPDDMKVYAIVGDTAMDITKTRAGEDPKKYDIYAVKGITVYDGVRLAVDDENIAVVDDENDTVYGTAEGEAAVTYSFAGGGTLTKKLRIVGPMTAAIESGDPAVMNQYLADQQDIVDTLNQAVKDDDIAAIKDFFSVVQTNSIFNVDAVSNRSLLEIDNTQADAQQKTELDYFAERVAAAGKEYICSSIDAIKEMEQSLLKELYTGRVCNLSAPTEETDAIKTAIEENNTILNLPVDNKYYIECEKAVHTALSNLQFTCYDQLVQTFKEAYVMAAYKNAGLSEKYLITMLDDCAAEIGYDADHYSAIKDKTTLAKNLISADINTVAELKTAIDSYRETAADDSNTGSTGNRRPSSGGGSGGSFGGGVRFEENLDVLPEAKPNTDPVVDRVQIFSDVPESHWGYEPIRYLNAIGAADGYEDGMFMPDASVTRAEFLKLSLVASDMLVTEEPTEEADETTAEEAEQTTEGEIVEDEPLFNDVDVSAWYYPYVKAAADAGVLQGDNQNNANPDAAISREEAAVILHRIMTGQGKTLAPVYELIRFTDANAISDWAVYAISELQVGGVINGDNGAMRPADSITRAESAKMIYELIQREVEVTISE